MSDKVSSKPWPIKPSRALWAAVLVPPALWAAQGTLGWYVGGQSCAGLEPGWSPRLVRVVLQLMTVLAIGVVGALLVVARRRRRDAAGAEIGAETGGAAAERARFVATLAIVAGVTLLLGVVLAGLPSVMVQTCGQAR